MPSTKTTQTTKTTTTKTGVRAFAAGATKTTKPKAPAARKPKPRVVVVPPVGKAARLAGAKADNSKAAVAKASNGKAPAKAKGPRKDSTGKPTAAECGFPAVYCAENGRFRPGLDARAKADLRGLLGLPGGNTKRPPLAVVTKAKARALLASRGW